MYICKALTFNSCINCYCFPLAVVREIRPFSPSPCRYPDYESGANLSTDDRWSHCFAIIQLPVVLNTFFFFNVFLTIGIKPLVNCFSFAKLLMYHKSSALIKLVQSPRPHKALHKTGLKSTELFLNTTYLL